MWQIGADKARLDLNLGPDSSSGVGPYSTSQILFDFVDKQENTHR